MIVVFSLGSFHRHRLARTGADAKIYIVTAPSQTCLLIWNESRRSILLLHRSSKHLGEPSSQNNFVALITRVAPTLCIEGGM